MKEYLEMAKTIAKEEGIETPQKVIDYSRNVLEFYGLPEQ